VRTKQFALCLTAILAINPGAAFSTPDQFAYRARVSESKQALQRIELPLEVLLSVTRADLGDVVVFDASGKPLPSWIRKAMIAESQQRYDLPIYLFNTYQQNRSKTLTTREQYQDSNELSESTSTEIVPIDEAIQDYIVGLPETEAGLDIESVELKWTHEPADQLLRLRVDVGNDLDNWRTIQENKSLTSQNAENAEWRSIGAIPRWRKIPAPDPNQFNSLIRTNAGHRHLHSKIGRKKSLASTRRNSKSLRPARIFQLRDAITGFSARTKVDPGRATKPDKWGTACQPSGVRAKSNIWWHYSTA